MINKPTTREQARQNAILAVEEAQRHVEPTGVAQIALGHIELGKVWAAIAETFPEDDDFTVAEAPEGMTLVHEAWVEDAIEAIDFKNRHRVEPGYNLIAATPQEHRTLMALRTGQPKDPQPHAKGTASVPATTGTIVVDANFYMVLMAVVVSTITNTETGMLMVSPGDIEATRDRVVTMSRSDLPGEGPMWGLRVTDSES